MTFNLYKEYLKRLPEDVVQKKEFFREVMSWLDVDVQVLDILKSQKSNDVLMREIKQHIGQTIDAVLVNKVWYFSSHSDLQNLAQVNISTHLELWHARFVKILKPFYDGLTWVLNRAFYAEWESLNKQDYTLFFVDLNNLKQINDAQWHAAWDRLIQDICEYLKSIVRSRDHIVRFWGDEFLIIIESTHPDMIARMNKSLSQSQIPISFGYAHSQEAQTTENVRNLADARMYDMKQNLKNSFVKRA